MTNNHLLNKIFLISLSLFFANIFLFIYSINHPIFDEFEHLLDVKTYLTDGINMKSLQLHGNESGVLSYWFWAVAGQIFGNHLVVFRLANCLVLLIFFVIVFKISQQNIQYRNPIIFSMLFLLGSPYVGLLGANILTETLSILLFLLTCWSLISYRQKQQWFYLFLACFCMGLCLITRFYQVALLGAFGTFLLLDHFSKPNFKIAFVQFLAMLIGLSPLIWIIYQWHGIVPPIFKSRYPEYVSELGLNFKRPLVALSYIGFWLSPLVWLSERWIFKTKPFIIGLLGCLIFSFFLKSQGIYLWNVPEISHVSSGFIHFLVQKIKHFNSGFGYGFDAILMGYSLWMGMTIFFHFFYEIKVKMLPKTPLINTENAVEIFLFLYLIFYILEQFFVTGNIPFFERYLLIIYPAMGFLGYQFMIKDNMNWKTYTYLMFWIVFSCINLWRFTTFVQPKRANFQMVGMIENVARTLPNERRNH
jgi:Dolichyl-phosphate-mannose-protein mannosyltransferase